MKNDELKTNEMEQASGGNFFADLEDVLRNIFQEPKKPAEPDEKNPPENVTARGKC